MKITFERFSVFFIGVNCFDQVSVLCCLAVLKVLSKFSMISSVLGLFWSKNSSFCQKILFFCLVMTTLFISCFHCALTVFKGFDQIPVLCCWAVFVVFKQQV